MSLLRALLILLAFFGALFYFKDSLQSVAPSFGALHSAYSEPFKALFRDITSATSSSLLRPGMNYVPLPAGSATTSYSPQPSDIPPTKANSTEAVSIPSSSTVLSSSVTNDDGSLLPVISDQPEGGLSISGIVAYTNAERTKQGLPSLRVNTSLTSSAEAKLQDMFTHQYFEHVSPAGQSVSDLVRASGYDYIVTGENLALGIFSGDDQVVAAWMASPGHKRNILDARYQDVGVAVGQGVYQGKKQWLIVQHFGKPLSSCNTPDVALKQTIETEKDMVSASEVKITDLRTQVDATVGADYSAKASEYNVAVTDYNQKLAQLKSDVAEYNDAAKAYNVCAGILNNS